MGNPMCKKIEDKAKLELIQKYIATLKEASLLVKGKTEYEFNGEKGQVFCTTIGFQLDQKRHGR
jgi:hypothetical protein